LTILKEQIANDEAKISEELIEELQIEARDQLYKLNSFKLELNDGKDELP